MSLQDLFRTNRKDSEKIPEKTLFDAMAEDFSPVLPKDEIRDITILQISVATEQIFATTKEKILNGTYDPNDSLSLEYDLTKDLLHFYQLNTFDNNFIIIAYWDSSTPYTASRIIWVHEIIDGYVMNDDDAVITRSTKSDIPD